MERIIPALEVLDGLEGMQLPDEYYYANLPVCILDAVCSIGIRYQTVQAVVRRYCEYFRLPRVRSNRMALPSCNTQHTVSAFVSNIEQLGVERFTSTVIANRCRTSTHSGSILKSEAALEFARVLTFHGIDTLQDAVGRSTDVALDGKLRSINGQRSGISVRYSFMLAGTDDLIKPGRMILRFLQRVLTRPVSPVEAQVLFTRATAVLHSRYSGLTPRALDYLIWDFERSNRDDRAR